MRKDIQAALGAALPIMLGYIAIGIPCGVMESEVGIGPVFAFCISATFYSGAGQFMMPPMLAYCVAPLFALKGRELPPRLRDALSLIPPAAFAALVANDILQPDLWTASSIRGLVPIIAALIVAPVAKKSASLVATALVGMAVYALLSYAVAFTG